ncbi:MAG TPA: sugar phosphate isomerase/epimerase [Caldilineaceae bacterium]|nr:sugar phosphate isomerase/epimerase [Caldilineaceae bacterium]
MQAQIHEQGPRLSVSTWSLHRTLGDPPSYGPEVAGPLPPRREGGIPLLELPERLAAFGIHTLEICHFHLPSRDPGYLDELRGALQAAQIELWSLLIDAGDVTDPAHGPRDEAWITGWLPVAARLGAARARVVAGKQPPGDETLARSEAGLRRLSATAQEHGLRLMTENWLGMMRNATVVNRLLDALDGQVGLCADFGNWQGPDKYDELAAILPRAESCHAKCHFDAAGVMDQTDYTRCLDLSRAAGFRGPYTLIYDGPDPDEWAGLARERAVVQPYVQPYPVR